MNRSDEPRWVAPGGWRRAALGLAIGAVIGAVVSRSLAEPAPRERA